MTFPTTAVLTNFPEADGTDLNSGNWTAVGTTMEVQGNAATGTISGANTSYWNVGDFGPDVEAFYTVSTKSASGAQEGLLIRLVNIGVGTTDGYYLQLAPAAGTDSIIFNRLDNGVATAIGAAFSQEVNNGDSIGVEMIGDTATIYYKPSAGSWTALGTRTDATYGAAGKIGLLSSNTVNRMDDFGGGTFVPAGGATNLMPQICM